MKNNKKGFTLAEVLIALTVLGIVASLTIPTVIQKQREAANRTKIKKSMTVYDRMFAKMIIENNLKSEQAVRDFVKADCSNTASYFKIAEKISTENSCTFKTSDGVFWNIEDIFHPIISLNKDDLDDLTSKNTFRMVTTFDPKTGAFRTNDLQYEIANNGDEEEMEKLFTFVKPELGGGNGGNDGNTITDDLFGGKLDDLIVSSEVKKLYDDFQGIDIWNEFNANNKKCSTINGKEYCPEFSATLSNGTYSVIYLGGYPDAPINCNKYSGCTYSFLQADGLAFTARDCQLESGKMSMNNCSSYIASKKLNDNVSVECKADATGKCINGTNSYTLSSGYAATNGSNCDSNGKNCEECIIDFESVDCSQLYAESGI